MYASCWRARHQNDLGDVPEHLRVCEPGKGVAVSFMDRSSIASVDVYKTMLRLGDEQNIPHQIKSFVAGGNDAGAVQRRECAVATCVLSVPCRNIHSPVSVASLNDMQAQADLVKAYLTQL